jgi:hypothetical protein
MRSEGRRAGAVILSLLALLAGCADSDVTFPPGDSGSDGVAEASADTSVDARNDQSVGRSDAPLDLSTDPAVDAGVDATVADADATTADRADSRADTAPPDAPADDASDDNITVDVPAPDGANDVVSEPAIDVDDGSRDAVSEEPPTCGSHCASGVCDVNGDCTPCVKDDECTGGRVCNNGTCGPRCGDGGVACTGSLVCCTDHCVDTTRDPEHCGACGTTCPANQFCGNASTPVCKDDLIRNVCNTKKATFLLDGLSDDDASSNVLKSAISALCVPAPTSISVSQATSVAINTNTGQPLAGGGELLVAAGGDSTQVLVKYLETSGTSSVYNESPGTNQLEFRRRGGAADGGDAVIQAVDLTTITPTHDFFLVEVVKDPISGTFSLVVYGVESPGTKAGAFYFANVILPNVVGADVTTFTQAWYLYEWTNADASAGPSMADTFTLVDSGL